MRSSGKAPTWWQTKFQSSCQALCSISFRTHLFISAILRIMLICYGHYHDAHSEVPYTDIDYKVVTDGARQVLQGQSPFARHTYRYSPILAYIQIPNIWWHSAIGKIIYAAFDLLVAALIYVLVRAELHSQCRKAVQYLLNKIGKTTSTTKNYQETDARNRPEQIACASACFWLYNPLTAIISTRGNGDSFASFFVILTIYLLARAEDVPQHSRLFVFAAGLAHGFAIHLRLYPLLFSLAYFLSLSDVLTNGFGCFLRQLLLPSGKQLLLISGTLLSLLSVTGYFYYLYGWQYLYEAYLYHFIRKDARHNFSLYFLMQYLGNSPENSSFDSLVLEKLLVQLAQLLLLVYLSFSFGQFRQTIPFCIFALAFVMVTFNSVVTSQYFIWYLSLLPLCLNNFTSIGLRKATLYFAMWLAAQALWLLPAYLLEFKSWNTFYWLGAQSALFFLVNNYILTQLIQHYSFTIFKVNFKKLF